MLFVVTVALALLCSCKAPANGGQSSEVASASGSANAGSAVSSEALEKNNDSTSIANLRSAYAEAMSAYLMEEETSNISIKLDDGKISTVSVSGVEILTEQANDWSGLASDSMPFPMPDDGGQPIEDATVTFTFDVDGQGAVTVTSTTYAPTAS